MTSRYAVCLSVDARMLIPGLYVAHAVRMLSRSNDVDVIVATGPDDADDTARAWMERNGIIHCDDIDTSPIKDMAVPQERLSLASPTKLLLPGHFAGRYEKMLFLDADITIHDDVTALFALDTGPHVLAATPAGRIWTGVSESLEKATRSHFAALGMTPPFRYFNAGVLYFDVAKWNRSDVLDRALDFLRGKPELCQLMDEDALNAVLDGDIAELSPIWNAVPRSLSRHAPPGTLTPVIIHHMGLHKPWKPYGSGKSLFADRSAYRLYGTFLRDTPWAGWLRQQWTMKDLRKSLGWDYRRLSRRLRGKSMADDLVDPQAYAAAVRRHYAETSFADVAQGITLYEDGRLRLNPNANRQPDRHTRAAETMRPVGQAP